MNFETSCWSTGSSLINSSAAFFDNVDNPVQRRPKIDYFDSSSITPIVSHISSNGYYGYCPPTTLADVHQENIPPIHKVTANNTDFSMSDMDIPVKIAQAMAAHTVRPTAEKHLQQPMHHQGRIMFENRKRTVQCIDEYYEQDIKRRRRNQLSVIDFAEDMQMGYDDIKDATSNAFANFAANGLPIDQYFVCIQHAIDQIKFECDTNKLDTKPLICSKKTENYIAAAAPAPPTAAATAEMITKETTNVISEMETLYWHTHGSLLWQH